ncbi:protein UsfY [Mycobacterium sp. Marseille-P9652]|uniref:protein UsfY n=1 Tax=Mycobacterium sp. Marseille-P9652 TaxID=2654950 RepID=UPI0012E7B9DC|nr:protein UsfY [Mycobacterium sp. Marseille-P9652]
MGSRHRDPTDHFRTVLPHAGITMKDNLYWPGFILLAVAVSGMIGATVTAAYRHYEWLATTTLVAVLGTIAAAMWFVVETRRVRRIDDRWSIADDTDSALYRRAATPDPTRTISGSAG